MIVRGIDALHAKVQEGNFIDEPRPVAINADGRKPAQSPLVMLPSFDRHDGLVNGQSNFPMLVRYMAVHRYSFGGGPTMITQMADLSHFYVNLQ